MQKVTVLCHVEENTWIDRPDLRTGDTGVVPPIPKRICHSAPHRDDER